MRLFLGATFLYAGIDKLIDPTFLRAAGPGSIGAQLAEFVKVSPIAPLVQVFGQPFPVQMGFLIAVAEIAIGLGALTGLLFRLSAAGGLALSITFWLTASWATTPYYYGPDLPYAFGWLTIALAGAGERFTIDGWFRDNAEDAYDDEPISPERRAVLKAGFLGLASLAVAAFAGTVGASVLGRARTELASSGASGPSSGAAAPAPNDGAVGAATPSPVSTAGPGQTAAAGASQAPAAGPVVARVSQLGAGRTVAFNDPISGDPGVLVKLADGKIVAFDAVCTHAGCTVEWDPSYDLLVCPCHGAAFDPAQDAQPVAGPTRTPLSPIPIHVDTASGRITVNA